MLIDFNRAQLDKFDALAQQILAKPHEYVQFDSIADFYSAEWLKSFPKGTFWRCAGQDDGAEHFYTVICYKNRRLSIDTTDTSSVIFKISDEAELGTIPNAH